MKFSFFSVAIAMASTVSALQTQTQVRLAPLPPGVASGLYAAGPGNDDYELVFHPPQEDTKMVNDAIDSVLKIEETADAARSADYLAEKQRLLNAEIAKVHSLIGNSFLGSVRRTADWAINMHAPEESASDVHANLAAIRRTEASKAASANAEYTANKRRLIAAEIAKIHHIVGH